MNLKQASLESLVEAGEPSVHLTFWGKITTLRFYDKGVTMERMAPFSGWTITVYEHPCTRPRGRLHSAQQ